MKELRFVRHVDSMKLRQGFAGTLKFLIVLELWTVTTSTKSASLIALCHGWLLFRKI